MGYEKLGMMNVIVKITYNDVFIVTSVQGRWPWIRMFAWYETISLPMPKEKENHRITNQGISGADTSLLMC